jgi:hypothetical protein
VKDGIPVVDLSDPGPLASDGVLRLPVRAPGGAQRLPPGTVAPGLEATRVDVSHAPSRAAFRSSVGRELACGDVVEEYAYSCQFDRALTPVSAISQGRLTTV